MIANEPKGELGSTFDSFLEESGIKAEVHAQAVKEIIADQLAVAMKEQGLTKVAMAERMDTTRQTLDRLLDPEDQSVTLVTLQRAARAVGRSLTIELR